MPTRNSGVKVKNLESKWFFPITIDQIQKSVDEKYRLQTSKSSAEAFEICGTIWDKVLLLCLSSFGWNPCYGIAASFCSSISFIDLYTLLDN